MPFRAGSLYLVVLGVALGTACTKVEKTENPLTPTVAGPIPGVSITMPLPLEPKDGAPITVANQPITLVLQNSVSTGARPLTYVFEVATDPGFGNRILVREGIPPGQNNRTSLRLPEALPTGRTYYWRSRAEDGANAGAFSGPVHFSVFTPIVIDRPFPQSPVNNQVLSSSTPRFVVSNAARSGPVGAIIYIIEVADDASFSNKFAIWQVPEQPSQTRLEAPSGLPYGKTYFWHARAYDGNASGPWSDPQTFRTPEPPVISPTNPTSPSPAPRGCTLPQPTPFQTLQCARSGYPHPMNGAHRGALMNQVAWHHRGEGWGMHRKDSGNRCPQPRTSNEISCDILVHGPSGGVFDVLINEEEPTWGYKGLINSPANFVAPVQP